jgi:hypothetical protein
VTTEWAVRPAILTTTTIGGGQRMRKNASLPAHTFDQAEMPTGSGRGAPSRSRARPPNGHATDLHTLPCRRLRGDGGGPPVSEGLHRRDRRAVHAWAECSRGPRRPSRAWLASAFGNRSRDDARRGRPRMLPKYSSQCTKRSPAMRSPPSGPLRCALRQRIVQATDHRVTPVKPPGGRPAATVPPPTCGPGPRRRAPNPRGPGVLDVHPRQDLTRTGTSSSAGPEFESGSLDSAY